MFKFKFSLNKGEKSSLMRREVMSITWPAMIELVLSTLFGMVDMIMVGQLSPASITAVGLTNQPFMLLLAIFAAVNVGTTTLVAWNIGAKDEKSASDVVRQTIIINIILGSIISVVGYLLAHKVVRFMGAEADTIKEATQYFQIVSAGLLFQALTMGITAALRGAGETKIPMLYNIGSNLLNVFGNYVLIYGKLGFPKMGVAGAALSTTFSRFVACAFGLYIIFSRISVVSIRLKGNYRFNKKIIKKMFSIGLPSALEQLVLQSGLILFARTVSGLGTLGYAAHQIGLNISGLSFAPSMAFGVAATTLTGQSIGANEKEKAEQYSNIIHHLALMVSTGVGIIFLLFSHPLARVYTDDLAVAAMAATVLKILAFAQPGQSTQLSLAGTLRGAGDTMYPLYASIFGIWIFRVAVAYLFVHVFGWGLIGAWVALVLDQYTRALIVFLRYKSGKWKDARSRSAKTKEINACS